MEEFAGNGDGLLGAYGGKRVPSGLGTQRGWRWCVLRTLRDLRLSVQRHRIMSLPMTRRLFQRRWAEICGGNPLSEQEKLGCRFIQVNFALQVRQMERRTSRHYR